MPAAIDFYFDFSSPFGYLCSERIEAAAARHGREVAWHPILLGVIFKVSGQRPLIDAPLKGDYSVMDLYRAAREHAIAFEQPRRFPIASVAACRSVYWLLDQNGADSRERAADWIHVLFRALYVDGRPIDEPATVLELAAANGIDHQALEAALASADVKQRLREAVDQAIACGVFGSPMMIVDDQPFWGNDRLDQLERWLERGGW